MKITKLKIGKIYTYSGDTNLAVYATPEMFNTKKVGRINPSETVVILATIREFAHQYWIQVLTATGIVAWFVCDHNYIDRNFSEEITS